MRKDISLILSITAAIVFMVIAGIQTVKFNRLEASYDAVISTERRMCQGIVPQLDKVTAGCDIDYVTIEYKEGE